MRHFKVLSEYEKFVLKMNEIDIFLKTLLNGGGRGTQLFIYILLSNVNSTLLPMHLYKCGSRDREKKCKLQAKLFQKSNNSWNMISMFLLLISCYKKLSLELLISGANWSNYWFRVGHTLWRNSLGITGFFSFFLYITFIFEFPLAHSETVYA